MDGLTATTNVETFPITLVAVLGLLDSVRRMQCSDTRSLDTLLHPRSIVAKYVRAKKSRAADS